MIFNRKEQRKMYRPFRNETLRKIIKREKINTNIATKNFLFINFLHATTKIVPATAI